MHMEKDYITQKMILWTICATISVADCQGNKPANRSGGQTSQQREIGGADQQAANAGTCGQRSVPRKTVSKYFKTLVKAR